MLACVVDRIFGIAVKLRLIAEVTPGAFDNALPPAAGSWWILVQNWAGSTSQPDLIKLVDVMVPGTAAGNFGADGPAAVPSGTPFDLEIFWDEPAAETGDIWFGVLDLGTDPGSPDFVQPGPGVRGVDGADQNVPIWDDLDNVDRTIIDIGAVER